MRANIAGLIVLAGILAPQALLTPGGAVVGPEEISRTLTQAEMDCSFGGKATCIDVAVNTTQSCLVDAGVDGSEVGDNLYNMIVGGLCALDGAYTGIVCAWDWFTSLF